MKITLNSLVSANNNAVSSVRNGKKDNIISRVLYYVTENHKDLTVSHEELQEYIKLANFQNYFKVDGLVLAQKFTSLKSLLEYIVTNQDKIKGSTKATKDCSLDIAITTWLNRAKPYINSHFLNDGDTGQMSLNFDKAKRFAYNCKEDGLNVIFAKNKVA